MASVSTNENAGSAAGSDATRNAVACTQAEYDSATKDAKTLYFIY